jgi:hypothetical protein
VACPGGEANPVICVPPKVSDPDTSSACICKPGYYPDPGSNGCLECLRGNACPDGRGLVPCPRHTYQDGTQPAASRIACTKCTSTGDETGSQIQRCGTGRQAAWCDRDQNSRLPSQSQALDLNCVDCNCCNTDYYQSQKDCKTNCYI